MTRIEMTEDEFREAVANYEGRCRACGAEAHGVEGDAEGYACDVCGAEEVAGVEQLLILGELDIA